MIPLPFTATQPYVFLDFPHCMLPLTRDYFAIVDKADFGRVSQNKWVVRFNGWGKPYAKRKINFDYLPLQNAILDVPRGIIVDHKNGDALDNRRGNLRVCTHFQNFWNRPAANIPTKTSKYKGVHKIASPTRKRWCAQICAKGKRFTLGTFLTAEDAAYAYNLKAIELFGEFAVLNDIPPRCEG